MSKAQPQIDFSLHKAPYKDLYDIQILFPDGTNQFWSGINENKVMWLCEKYNPISTPLSIAIAPRFYQNQIFKNLIGKLERVRKWIETNI